MSAEYSPDGQHDFITEELRQKQESINGVVMDAYYGQMCTDFRGQIFQKLMAHGALQDGQGWAIFDLNTGEIGSVALADGAKDVLINVSVNPNASELAGKKLPDVHIVTNEQIVGLNGNLSFLTYDFALDYENDARYLADGVWPAKDNSSLAFTRYGALFCFDEQSGRLIVMNRPPNYFTQAMTVSDGQRTVSPFGSYCCLEDKIQALNFAHEVLQEIAALKPTHTSKSS